MRELRSYAANRYRRHLLSIWESRGGGFYGFVTLLTFVYLEVLDLGGDIVALQGVRVDLGFAISWLIGNFVDAIVNMVRAAIWPVSWIGQFGVSILSGTLLAGSYVAYRAVRPTVLRWLTPTDEPATASLASSSERA